MIRVLVLGVAVFALLWLLRRAFGRWRGSDGSAAPGAENADGTTGAGRSEESSEMSSELLPCAHCGVLVPRAEVIESANGRTYCSQEHLRLGAQDKQG